MSDTPAERFSIRIEREIRVIELLVSADVESIEFDAINTSLSAAVASHDAKRWVLDMTQVGYAGSALLGLLVNLRSAIRRKSGTLVLCCMDPMIERTLRTGSMERLFVIVDTREDALASF